MKIIVFSYNIPRPDRSSGERRFVSILELLARDHEVDLCVSRYKKDLLKPEPQRYIPLLESRGINVMPVKADCVRKSLTHKKYDMGFFEFYWIAQENLHLFLKYQPGAVTLVDSVDVHYAREESQASIGLIPWEKAGKTKKNELNVYNSSDIILAVSEEDEALLRKEKLKSEILLVPNIVPTVKRSENRREPIAVFIGSYAWPPNVDAMNWFTKEIWPLVYSKNSEARLQVIGSSPPPEIEALKSLPGIEVTGFVPDTTLYLGQAAVSIAPLRYGGGMKGKVNEALAHGVPVVTTSFGAQGFQVKNGEEMIVTDDPGKFAEAILLLFDEPELQEKIGLAGQALNERYCSLQTAGEKINDMIRLAERMLTEKQVKSSRWKVFNWAIRQKIRQADEIIKYYRKKLFSK
jgi:glycosyltransferase involved in cell wall biosynthesis